MTTDFRNMIATIACTIVMSATCVVAAVGPATTTALQPTQVERAIA